MTRVRDLPFIQVWWKSGQRFSSYRAQTLFTFLDRWSHPATKFYRATRVRDLSMMKVWSKSSERFLSSSTGLFHSWSFYNFGKYRIRLCQIAKIVRLLEGCEEKHLNYYIIRPYSGPSIYLVFSGGGAPRMFPLPPHTELTRKHRITGQAE